MYRTKLIRPEVKVLDGQGRIEAIVSSEAPDRDGDIIRVEGWDLKPFLKHPVLVASHDYLDLRNQIGEWEDMKVDGKKLVGVARYYVGEGNEQVDWGFNLASKGRAAFSVGFIPDMEKAKELEAGKGMWGSYEFNGQELLEVSHVIIPSNPQALQMVKALRPHPIVAGIVDDVLKDISPFLAKAESGECMMPGCKDRAAMSMPMCKDCAAKMMRGASDEESRAATDSTLQAALVREGLSDGIRNALREVLHAQAR